MLKYVKLEYKIQGGNSNTLSSKERISDRKIYNRLQIHHLISLKEYKEYLNRGNELLDAYSLKRKNVELNNAIFLLKKRFTTYRPPQSNMQFKTIYDSNVIHRNRLIEMISYFLYLHDITHIEGCIQYGKKDLEIFKQILKNKHTKKDIYSKKYRIHKICNSIIKYLPKDTKPILLDIGIGSGTKTKEIQDIIGCNIYGADLEQWGPYSLNTRDFSFPVKAIKKKPYHIPYPDKSFDCITLILVLHHSEDIIEMISECKRLLKDDGFIAIIEHDVWTDELHMLLDLQHKLFAYMKNEKMRYYANYYNFYEWDILFDKCDMKPVYGDRIHEDASYRIRYDSQFIAIYKKK